MKYKDKVKIVYVAFAMSGILNIAMAYGILQLVNLIL